jgi:EAL domain-containing protein (putative c-di-GMP-specific phosphodiesterase class I)/GGDEF domain-containing protein
MAAVAPGEFGVMSFDGVLAALSTVVGPETASQALFLIELDDPLDIRAQLGPQASSALVSSMAADFKRELGERATVLRLGDESCCVLINAVRNDGHARLAAEKLARTADSTMSARGMVAKPKLGVGIALYPRDAAGAEELLRKAKLASSAARKRSVRILVYDDDCADEVEQSATLGAAFAEALESGSLAMCYQPKVWIESGQVSGVESLMRWRRDGKAVASPDVFIPLAEKAGLIHDVTWYGLSNSLRTSAEFGGLHVAVNITPAMLHHDEFVAMIETAVRSWKVAAGVLTLELTEGALISDFEKAHARLMRVRELGVRISIDDFGTGYSSLSYFKKIPADELKIDKSFVLGMLKDEADQRLVGAIITLSKQFNLEVVAEGVEDQETLVALSRMGCDHAQGYFFSPALPSEQLRTWLATHAAQTIGGQRLHAV